MQNERNRTLNIVILAAGKGTRMYSKLPKVLHPLAGKPMLTHVLDTARQLHPSKIIVVYGFEGETIRRQYSAADLLWAEQHEQLGTGHAVQQTLPFLDDVGYTLILLGDVPLIEAHTCEQLLVNNENEIVLLTVNKANPFGYGRIKRNEKNNVVGIVEEKDASVEERQITEVNTGIMVFPNQFLKQHLIQLNNHNAQKEYYLTDLIDIATNNSLEIKTVLAETDIEVTGVNNRKDLQLVERAYQKIIAEKLMLAGVTLADASRMDVRGALDVGQDVSIDVGCIFEGDNKVSDDVVIGAHCYIRNSTIAAGTTILPYSHIDDAIIGEGCRIGPYARLRPDAVIGNDSHIGNFVEIKNSDIGMATNINHLSYVGDSTVGNQVNIGAGTITCNYDGANKHKTVIKDGAFIGSDSQLVAPVTIGENATIAAGSTITKNAPDGELTISRGRQVTITGWKRPKKASS